MAGVRHVIDGEAVESLDGAVFESVDPWTQEPWAEVSLGGPADADRALAAARRAFDEGPWPKMALAERQAILHKVAAAVEDHAAELSEADSRDMGKPIQDMLGREVGRSAHNLRFFADHMAMSTGRTFPMDSGHHAYERFEPAGVVAAISPWNFPLMLETWKIAPALAWGNTVVLKPAEESPSSASLLAEIALGAGLPPGVLNVVHGFGPDGVGEALTSSSLVDRITFTGESATGRAVAKAASSHLVPVSLELGGKGASVVFEDADLDSAAAWCARAGFSNAGQVCLAGSRLLVQASVYDEFIEAMVAIAEKMTVGNPAEHSTEIGPLSSQQHFAKVTGYLDDVPEAGGKLATGGRADGWAVRPTLVTGLPHDAPACNEEIFGPVITVQSFETETEGVELANRTRFGLNAMCFTTNLSRAHRVSKLLRAGTVWVNCFFVRDLRAPFGGVGDSGIGREGGDYSREFFTEPKAVVMAIDGSTSS